MKRRTDSNQTAIVNALRQAGCSVAITSELGLGFPDLCVGRSIHHGCRHTFLLEIKDGGKSPSRRHLTEAERAFRDNWRGHYAVVTSVDEALIAVGITA